MDVKTETAYAIQIETEARAFSNTLLRSLGNIVRTATMLCDDDAELGREVLKIYHGYLKALDSVK